MNHLINVLYVVAGILVYEKVVKPMLDKEDDGTKPNKLENAEDYD